MLCSRRNTSQGGVPVPLALSAMWISDCFDEESQGLNLASFLWPTVFYSV